MFGGTTRVPSFRVIPYSVVSFYNLLHAIVSSVHHFLALHFQLQTLGYGKPFVDHDMRHVVRLRDEPREIATVHSRQRVPVQ